MMWRCSGGIEIRFRDLRALTAIVTAMVVMDAAYNPFILLWVTLNPGLFNLYVTPIATQLDLAETVFKIATYVVFGRWIYVAGCNLVAADLEGLEFTPGARIWWFAVPFANLVMPFRGMRELWNGSRNVWPLEQNHPLIAAWWALWLARGLAGALARVVGNDPSSALALLTFASVMSIALAGLAITMIHGIARGQSQFAGEELSEVFA